MSGVNALQDSNSKVIETTFQPAYIVATSEKKDSLRILHVDDEPCFLEISKQILTMDNNFEVDTALSVDEAFQKMERQTYDAIVSDYEMPLKNGLDFLRELRKERNEIPFILFTGKGREDVAVKALNLGADSCLNKNGSPETVYCELAHAINKTVEQRKSRKLLAASESNYRMLVEKSLQGILVTLADPLRLVFANDTMGKILGYSSQELMSLSPERIMGLVYREDRAVFFKLMENRFRGEPAESSLEFRAVRKDGSIIWLSALSNRVEYDGQPAVQGMFLDINERKKAEKVLRKSEEKYRELANSLPEIVFEADLTGKITFFSQRTLETTGYTQEELEKGLNMLQFVLPEEQEKVKENFKKSITGKNLGANEYTLIRRNGTTYPALVKTTPIISENKVTGIRVLVIDITERKKAEESLKESEEKFRCLAEESPNMIFINLRGRVVYANKKCVESMGYSKEEFYSPDFNFLSICAPEYVEVLKSSYSMHMRGEDVPPYEYVLVARDGERIEAIIASKLIEYGGEKAILGIVTDITERKKAEEEQESSENYLKAIFKSVSTGIIIINAETHKIVDANPYALDTLGASKEQTVGKICHKFICPAEKGKCPISDLGQAVDKSERALLLFDGKKIPILKTVVEMSWKDQKYLVESFIDITDRKKAEAALKLSEERYRSLFESSIDGVMIMQPDGSILSANPVACRMLGMSEEELKKAGREGIIIKDEKLATALQERKRTGRMRADLTFRRKDGTTFVGEVSSGVFTDAGGIIKTSLTIRDATERKKTEEALSESQQKFKALFSSNPEAAVFLDTAFHVVEANSRFIRLFGYSLDEIKGRIITDVIVPEDSREESRILRQKAISGPVEIVTARIRKDGSQIPLFMSGGPVFVNEKVIGSVMVYKDISDIITVQEELGKALAKAELLNEKLRVVGSLSRHDVRNKLSAVAGYAYLLKKKHGDQADVIDGLSKIEQSVSDSVKIFDFAKIYEQLGIEELTYINVEKTLNEAMALFSGSFSLEVVNDCHGLTLLADSLLRQLFYDLIDNSLKHGEKVTKIRVHYEKVDQDRLIVVYEDDGVGISAENKPRLFKEGFSTSGTSGYGLFLVRKMMEVYSWAIEENGVPGKGAKFVIIIPRTSQSGKESFQIT